MYVHGLDIEIKNVPELDIGFIPLGKFNAVFLAGADEPFGIAISDGLGRVIRADTFIRKGTDAFTHNAKTYEEANRYYIESRIKTLLWQVGGCEVYLSGDEALCEYISDVYAESGARSFDTAFMSEVYSQPFRVFISGKLPDHKDKAVPLGRNFNGYRIGFDAGGSDRKVSAVINGETVYSKETVWSPKTESDPEYHYKGIVDAFKEAAAKMPQVDAIGISSAGIYSDNRALFAQLFGKVPKDLFEKKIRNIYIDAAKEIGDNIPIEVANDGDVTALAGSISLNRNNILGIAMGTSEAAGYIDGEGNITGWLNELAFSPVDASPNASVDDWSGDIGCGYQYFSQEAAIRLADAAGITFGENQSPGEKLKVVQTLLEENHSGAEAIFRTIGSYLAHTAYLYRQDYGMDTILLLGRVMSGRGGEIIVSTANEILRDEYAEVHIDLCLPNEQMRRLGQSVVAASLPQI